MERKFIITLEPGDRVDAAFAIRAKELRAARTGEAYLTLELGDRTGRIGGIMFRPEREAIAVPVGSIASVRGTITSYRGMPRVSIESIRAIADYDASEILPAGTRDPEELLGQLRALVASVKSAPLAAVLRKVFGDTDFMSRFKSCPASQGHHHAYIGGLLEHTVCVAQLCRSLADLYPHADVDLLVAGALLHDIGKVDELDFVTGIEYTDEGRMLGHVLLGERRVHSAMAALGSRFPGGLAMQLSHVLLAHHGELEWGSPKRPCTLEALVLHHADNLDAKTAGFIAAAASAEFVEEPWTDAGNLFRRPLWAPRAAEDDRQGMPAEDDQYARTA